MLRACSFVRWWTAAPFRAFRARANLVGQPGDGLSALAVGEDPHLAGADPAEHGDAAANPVLVRDERESLPGRAVLQPDGARGLEVFPERPGIEALELVGQLDEDPELLAALERRIDRRDQRVVVLVPLELSGDPEAEDASWELADRLDHGRTIPTPRGRV